MKIILFAAYAVIDTSFASCGYQCKSTDTVDSVNVDTAVVDSVDTVVVVD